MRVRQVDNVLDLFEFFASHQQAASLAEVSRHFGWPRSSTFNLLTTLAERGFLYLPKERKGYYPTPRLLALAKCITAAEPLPSVLVRLTEDLAERTGETVWIAVQSGRYAIFLHVIQSKQGVRYTADVGQRVPLYATATGQGILGKMSEAQRESFLENVVFKRYAANTPMDLAAVRESVRASMERGWFRTASAYSKDLGGVSVPIVFNDRIFAITVAGPLFRVNENMADIAREINASIAAHLGPEHVFGQASTSFRSDE